MSEKRYLPAEVPLFICQGIMPPTVQDILNILETIAPASLAEQWDNVGLMIGNPSDRVRSILIGLDPTIPLLDEAVASGSNLLITHHPIIFHPLKSVRLEQPGGKFINNAICNSINVVSCHTNLDSANPGLNDLLAGKLGLIDTEPLDDEEIGGPNEGLGRIGNVKPCSPEDFIERLKNACQPSWILEAGPRPDEISRIAVCGGSCSDLAETAMAKGAQVFVTAEVKHSVARWAEATGLWLLDAGHFATENPAMGELAGQLKREMQNRGIGIEIKVTKNQNSPLKLI